MEVPEISRVGIVGAGTIGTLITFRCIVFGKEVYLFDISPEALARAVDKNWAWLAEQVENGTVIAEEDQSIRSRLHPCYTLKACVADVELVIEAVPEKLELKRQVFEQINRWAPPYALIATNSSSIPCSRMTEVTERPDKLLNIHFGFLKDGAPVEVMGGPLTANETIIAGERFVRSLGMLPIMVKREIMGFGINTIWREIKKTALQLVDGGYLDFEDIDRAWILGFDQPRGLFAEMDLIGLDVVRNIEMQYYLASGDARDKPPQLLDDLIARGRLGVKSGQGFYTYPNPEYERPGWLQKEPPWTQDMLITLADLRKRR